MLRFFQYFVLFIVSLLWMAGCHPALRRVVFEAGLVKDSYRYGDLYRMANLAQFKQPTEVCHQKRAETARTPVHLYIIGDSFTEKERIAAEDFVSEKYERVHWNDSIAVHLNKTKRNILVLQTVERHFREHFSQSIKSLRFATNHLDMPSSQPLGWSEILEKSEEGLVDFLFSGDWALFLKEWKAAINLNWFGRHNDQVALSPNGDYLLFCWDTDSLRITSSFKRLPDDELNSLVESVNKAQQKYLSLGFDEVYLSIIPNKTSIVAPEMGNYNRLVERVQQHPQLKMPIVNIWNYYQQNASTVYAKGDTHWSCQGRAYWLEKVNNQLIKKAALGQL